MSDPERGQRRGAIFLQYFAIVKRGYVRAYDYFAARETGFSIRLSFQSHSCCEEPVFGLCLQEVLSKRVLSMPTTLAGNRLKYL